MKPFELIQATSTSGAVSAARPENTMYIAGGTNMVDLMKYHVLTPSRLVSVRDLNLKGITLDRKKLTIGSGETMTDVAYNADVARYFPGIRDGLLLAASQGLRNSATMGGNIMQRTRCPYYRDPSFACNRREPGSGCAAMEGWNRYNAILGVSDKCIAAHFSDVSNVLAALEATVVVQGPNGERNIAFTDFHLLPGDNPEEEFALQPGELILRLEVPRTKAAEKSVYVKIRDRNSYAFAISSAAAAVEVSGGRIKDAKLAIGAVGTKPWKVPQSEEFLIGKAPTETNFRRAAELATEGAVTRPFNEYKVKLSQNALIEALNRVTA